MKADVLTAPIVGAVGNTRKLDNTDDIDVFLFPLGPFFLCYLPSVNLFFLASLVLSFPPYFCL